MLLSISSYVTDLYNWVPYRYKSLSVKTGNSDVVYQRDGVKIYKNNNFDIMVFNPNNMSFGVSVGKPKNVNFYMNSNFFNKRAIGLVVVDGHRMLNNQYYVMIVNKIINDHGGNIEFISKNDGAKIRIIFLKQ